MTSWGSGAIYFYSETIVIKSYTYIYDYGSPQIITDRAIHSDL